MVVKRDKSDRARRIISNIMFTTLQTLIVGRLCKTVINAKFLNDIVLNNEDVSSLRVIKFLALSEDVNITTLVNFLSCLKLAMLETITFNSIFYKQWFDKSTLNEIRLNRSMLNLKTLDIVSEKGQEYEDIDFSLN